MAVETRDSNYAGERMNENLKEIKQKLDNEAEKLVTKLLANGIDKEVEADEFLRRNYKGFNRYAFYKKFFFFEVMKKSLRKIRKERLADVWVHNNVITENYIAALKKYETLADSSEKRIKELKKKYKINGGD